jgi:hypothetical protein
VSLFFPPPLPPPPPPACHHLRADVWIATLAPVQLKAA